MEKELKIEYIWGKVGDDWVIFDDTPMLVGYVCPNTESAVLGWPCDIRGFSFNLPVWLTLDEVKEIVMKITEVS